MAGIKSLAKDTAIYGLSSIVGRFLNWCLTPLYTNTFSQGQYGVVTLIYAVVALALIILTYGMETGFFRFANHERWKDPMQVYSTAMASLAVSGAAFIAIVCSLAGPISGALHCSDHHSFVVVMAVCVAIDAFTALPFSYLRYRSRAVRFAVVRLTNIALNIGLNLFFILGCPWLMVHAPGVVDWFYNPSYGVGYIFLANLIASAVTLVMLLPQYTGFRWRFNAELWRSMLAYSAPLLVLGVAGIMNQTLDKIIFPFLYRAPDAMAQLGIYGANYKIAIVMVMFTQAFRFAYEPFIFSKNKETGLEGSNRAYSLIMKYFIIASLGIFLLVMYYLPVLRYFISPEYFSGLKVVPVVMAAEFFFGVFFNLSVWYKLSDKTVWGMWFSLLGLAVTVALNVALVPHFGYMGSAWAAFCCYGVMMVASYFVGQKHRPINYQLPQVATYTLVFAALYCVGVYVVDTPWLWLTLGLRTLLLLAYAAFAYFWEKRR